MRASPNAVDDTLREETVEDLLTSHAFGDSAYITGQLHAHYLRRLSCLAEHFASAGEVAAALNRADSYTRYRIVGDTTFRCAVQHLQVQLETGVQHGLPLAQCLRLLDGAAQRLRQGIPGLVGPSLIDRIGPQPWHGWVWREDLPATNFMAAFRDIVDGHYGLTLCTPNDSEMAMLADAVDLLDKLIPKVAKSALSHTHLVAVFSPTGDWEGALSSSEFRMSGTVFLNRRLLDNVWTAAEQLLHESLHQQLYDLRRGHTLLNPGFADAEAPRIHSLWNRPDSQRTNHWDVHRALAAFHVYVHLTLFARRISADTEPAARYRTRHAPVRTTSAATAAARGRYLADQLRTRGWTALGAAGQHLVDWLDPILERLTPAPIVKGSFLHLLLDRYRREVAAVEYRASSVAAFGPTIAQELTALVEREIDCSRAVLTVLGHDTARFDAAVNVGGARSAVERFASSRTVIAETLIAACKRDYELAPSRVPDEQIRTMIEKSSESLKRHLES